MNTEVKSPHDQVKGILAEAKTLLLDDVTRLRIRNEASLNHYPTTGLFRDVAIDQTIQSTIREAARRRQINDEQARHTALRIISLCMPQANWASIQTASLVGLIDTALIFHHHQLFRH